MSEDDGGWRVIASETVIDSPHLRLRADRIELPGGRQIGPYYVRETLGFAVIFALSDDDRVVLVRQYKHGVAQTLLELPAGSIDPGETPEACARRELAEETGFGGADATFMQIAAFATDPTNSTARCYLYLARGVRRIQDQRLDETENITVEFAHLDDVRRFAHDGTIDVSTHIASIYLALENLGRL